MMNTKCLKPHFERMWHKKKEEKKCYLDDGSGPSKDTVHLNACKILMLRVTIIKENKKRGENELKHSWDNDENYLWNNCWREGWK